MLSAWNWTCLEESFILKLGNPCLGTVFGHIVLVVFVAHKSAEFVVVYGLGFDCGIVYMYIYKLVMKKGKGYGLEQRCFSLCISYHTQIVN